MNPKKNVYAIYASQDKVLAHDFLRRLQILERDYNVSIWHDKPVYPDQQWKPQNASRLQEADIFLLLVSNGFLYSPFIQQDEFKLVIDKYKDGKATVIPILLDNCPWDTEFNSDDYDFSFKELQVLPEDRKPISDWNSADEALKHVLDHVKKVIAPFAEDHDSELAEADFDENVAKAIEKEQIALNLKAETERKSILEQENRREEEAKIKKIAAEEKKLEEEAEAKKIALEDKKRKEEADAKKKDEEEKRLVEVAEAERIALEEKKEREEAEINKKAKEEKRLGQKTQVNNNKEEEKRLSQEADAKRKALEEKWAREEADIQKRIEEKKRKEEAEVKKKAEQELKLKEEIATKKRAEEEKRLKVEAETKRKALEEKKRKEEAETKRLAAQELQLREEALAKKRIEEESWERQEVDEPKNFDEFADRIDETQQGENANTKKRVLLALVVAALAILGLWYFNSGPDKPVPTLPNSETIVEEEAVSSTETKTDLQKKGSSSSKLSVGGTYDGSLIFTLDPSGKSGKIAYTKDVGPMPWKSAMNIHEELGEGWRLPTLDELKIMYKVIGNGASNSGQFTDELYWSATPFDANQARLLRFSDGNTSYHYNSTGTHRKFLVRAVREFNL